jgi:hypothetical protein
VRDSVSKNTLMKDIEKYKCEGENKTMMPLMAHAAFWNTLCRKLNESNFQMKSGS